MIKLLLYFYAKVKHRKIRGLIRRLIVKFDGGVLYSSTIRIVYDKFHALKIGYGTYGGCFNLSNVRPNIRIGNYCSISSRIDLLRANHPISDFTTHPIAHRKLFNANLQEDRFQWNELVIGHDVWIGQNVVVLPSCNFVGNGAIIGAGSIVTKDVPAYAIVAGNPAKLIKMRFSDEIIEKLEATKWWLWDKNTLIKHIDKLELIARGKA